MGISRLAGCLAAGATLAAAALLASAPAMAAPATPHHGNSEVPHLRKHKFSAADQKEELAYWTLKRMQSTKPLRGLGRVRSGEPGRITHGKPGLIPGGQPLTSAGRPPDDVASPMLYPVPYYRFAIPTAADTTWPYEENGRLFVATFAPFRAYWCSATSVASVFGMSDENEVWTSAHCTAPIFTSSSAFVVFVPGYNGGPRPIFGAYLVDAWSTAIGGDMSVNYSALLVNPSGGLTLGQTVGWDGFAWNQSPYQEFVSFGYPGGAMVEDRSVSLPGNTYIWTPPPAIGGPLIGIGDPQNPLLGADGGAWNIDWSPFGGGYLNGNDGVKVPGQPLMTHSSYFSTLADWVRCFGPPTCP
jgi:hypothetical protein